MAQFVPDSSPIIEPGSTTAFRPDQVPGTEFDEFFDIDDDNGQDDREATHTVTMTKKEYLEYLEYLEFKQRIRKCREQPVCNIRDTF